MNELREIQPDQEVVIHLGRDSLSKFLALCRTISSMEEDLPSTSDVEPQKAIDFHQRELEQVQQFSPAILSDAKRYIDLKSDSSQAEQRLADQILDRRFRDRTSSRKARQTYIFAATVHCLEDLRSLQVSPQNVLELKSHFPKFSIEEVPNYDETRLTFGGLNKDEVVLRINILGYDLERKPLRAVEYLPAKKQVKEPVVKK